MKKITLLLFTFISLLFFFPIVSFAEEKLDVIYFSDSMCISCRQNNDFIEELSKRDDITLIKYITNLEDCAGIQKKYAETYNVPENISLQVPAIYFGEHFYTLGPSNHAEVLSLINKYASGELKFENKDIELGNCHTSNTYEDLASKFTIGGILLAGLIDGINPCAISMLLVFYSFLIFSQEKKKILFISVAFIVGMFTANFTFGIGIKTFYNLFSGNNYILIFLYAVSILMCIVAVSLNMLDIINHNKSGEVKNQLSDNVKFKLTNVMRKASVSRFAVFIALLTGFLIGVVELSCTGQIYFPTLVYMISNSNKSFSFTIMLILYNLMFVVPLIVVTIAASFVKNTEKFKSCVMKNNHIMKILSNLVFIGILIILVKQLIELF